jgi:hypothetical protein
MELMVLGILFSQEFLTLERLMIGEIGQEPYVAL